MIKCINCGHEEFLGAFFCSECGAQLIYKQNIDTKSFVSVEQSDIKKDVLNKNEIKENINEINIDYSLEIQNHNVQIDLEVNKEYTIGRVTEGQPILPDIDLSVYKAYNYGVSRIHALIRIVDNKIILKDLNSANGTRVNGEKIVTQIEYPINRGDQIALGKFLIRIV